MVSSVLANAVINIVGNVTSWGRFQANVRNDLSGFLVFANKIGGSFASNIVSPLAALARYHQYASGTAFSNGATVGVLSVAVAAMGALFGKAAMAASHFNEQLARAEMTFGTFVDGVSQAADAMANRWGTVRAEFIKASAQIGDILTSGGLTGKTAADATIALANLSIEVASLKEISQETAMKKIMSGLSGRTLPLREIGVFMSEGRVKAKAFAMGLVQVGEELTDQQKIAARYVLISEGLKKAQGDKARSEGRMFLELERFWGHLTNILTDFGLTVAPMVGLFLLLTNKLLGGISMITHGVASLVATIWGFIDSLFGYETADDKKKRLEEINKENEKIAAEAAQEEADLQNAQIDKKKKKEKDAAHFGLVDFRKKIQEAIFDKKDDTQKRHLDAAVQQQQIQQKILDFLKNNAGKPAIAGP